MIFFKCVIILFVCDYTICKCQICKNLFIPVCLDVNFIIKYAS